jgi:hypothetical protein
LFLTHSFFSRQICQRPGHPQQTMTGPGRKLGLLHHPDQQGASRIIKRTICFEITASKFSVHAALPLQLPYVGCYHPLTHTSTGLPRLIRLQQCFGWQCRHLQLQVDPIQQRAGDLLLVAPNLVGGADTTVRPIVMIATGAGVHRRHQLKSGRVAGLPRCTGDQYLACFQWLTQDLKYTARILGQFIQEQNPLMRQRYFTGTGVTATTHQRNRRGRMVWCPETAHAMTGWSNIMPGNGADCGHFKLLFSLKWRQ